jgi:hypothetical protein
VAQAAGTPDFSPRIWPGKSDPSRNETFEIWFYANVQGAQGPVKLFINFPHEYREVRLVSPATYSCTRSYNQVTEMFPGHWIECEGTYASSLPVKVLVSAPPREGTYQFTAVTRSPHGPDANPGNDMLTATTRVRT